MSNIVSRVLHGRKYPCKPQYCMLAKIIKGCTIAILWKFLLFAVYAQVTFTCESLYLPSSLKSFNRRWQLALKKKKWITKKLKKVHHQRPLDYIKTSGEKGNNMLGRPRLHRPSRSDEGNCLPGTVHVSIPGVRGIGAIHKGNLGVTEVICNRPPNSPVIIRN